MSSLKNSPSPDSQGTIPSEHSLSRDAVGAIVSGTHTDPFAVLGKHELCVSGDSVIRAFLPGARSLKVRVDGVSGASETIDIPMAQLDAAGLFECCSPGVPDDYQLVVEYPLATEVINDAYQFGPWLDSVDHYLLGEGNHQQLYEKLGSHVVTHEGVTGTVFVVWAPNATRCSLIGDFNSWDGRKHVMRRHPSSGLWEIFVPSVTDGSRYKYAITDASGHAVRHKSDPFGNRFEGPPGNAAIVYSSGYCWQDQAWLEQKRFAPCFDEPMSIYEVHLPSWMKHPDERSYNYSELADRLIPHAIGLGFTHLELMPVTEHPFGGSWGYQPIGLFAPMERLGSPDEFRDFVDRCHQAGLGVIMDWVPAHFPSDEHGLSRFDGTALYEHEDPRLGFHREWNTCIFNYARKEVSNYLLSNALYWIKEFHLDGLRVDAVASMLYLDYSREDSEWLPNIYGGNENLEAVQFLKQLNTWVHAAGGVTFAEESTSWDGVTRPVEHNGLGFTYKWNMGWMNDILAYFEEDPINRKYHHEKLNFGLLYAFSENFVLPFSHDEVVYGKRSLVEKMPGDDWQKFANLRLLYSFLFTQPGKKLLFMGAELAQRAEWNHDTELHWSLLELESHRQIQTLLGRLNGLYGSEASLHKGDTDQLGFQWIDCDDADMSVLAYYRRVPNSPECVVCLFNFTPVAREDFRIGVYDAGTYEEVFNSDAFEFGGSNVLNHGSLKTQDGEYNGKPASLAVRLPPLGACVLKMIEL